MKRPGVCLSIVTILAICLLVACSPGGSASGRLHCSNEGEICISLSAVQSFSMGAPVVLQIKVSSQQDYSDLNVALTIGGDIAVDGPQTWENYLTSSSIKQSTAFWDFAIKTGQSLTFNRVLHFPSHEGYFEVIAEVVNPGRILDAIDSIYIHITKDGGIINKEGTPFPPYTPNFTPAVYGPGTSIPTILLTSPLPWMTTPSSTQFAPLVATITPTTPPYPPPSSPSPSPTSHPYP